MDCLHDYRLSVKVHGDEILNHANWEISVGRIADPIRALLKFCVRLGKMAQTLQVSQKYTHARISKLTMKRLVACLLTHRLLRWLTVGDEKEVARNSGLRTLPRLLSIHPKPRYVTRGRGHMHYKEL